MINWEGKQPKYPRGHCQACGYDLNRNVSGVCPECGISTRAWIEIACDHCGKFAVFPKEETGNVQACPHCKGPLDVPAVAKSGTELQPSTIQGTRLAVLPLIFITALFGFGFLGLTLGFLALLVMRPQSVRAGILLLVLGDLFGGAFMFAVARKWCRR